MWLEILWELLEALWESLKTLLEWLTTLLAWFVRCSVWLCLRLVGEYRSKSRDRNRAREFPAQHSGLNDEKEF